MIDLLTHHVWRLGIGALARPGTTIIIGTIGSSLAARTRNDDVRNSKARGCGRLRGNRSLD
jgi:hypothetical protein